LVTTIPHCGELRNYLLHSELGIFTSLVTRTLVALDSTLEDTVTWPDDDEFEEIIWRFRGVFPTQFRQIAVIVDGVPKFESLDQKTLMRKELLTQ
jgi:hypothetical protein